MTWFKNIKIGTKLILSFLLVALVAGIIGIVGLVSVNDIGNTRFPSVLHLQEAQKNYADMGLLQEVLLNSKTTYDERVILYTAIEEDLKNYDESVAKYLALKISSDERAVWNQIEESHKDWLEHYNDFAENLSRLDAIGIDNPQEIRFQLAMRKRDHINWIWQIQTAIDKKTKFTGQLDSKACALGLWLAEYKPRSEAFKSLMVEIEQSHSKVHDSGKTIVAYIALGDEESLRKAKSVYETVALVNMNIVLGIFDRMDAIAIEANEAYDTMEVAMQEEIKPAYASTINSIEELVGMNIESANEQVKSSMTLVISFVIVGIAISIGLGIVISNMIKKPITLMVRASEKMANGDLDVTIDVQSTDEIGTLALAFKRMCYNFNEVMTNIDAASDQVASGSLQVSDSSMSLSQGATEQASSIEQLTASIHEMASQIKLNAENADVANSLAANAMVNANRGNAQMKDVLASMDEMNNSSKNISKIIKVIDEIAFQTNILALNAAVEAARAGEHGKGFAVVAEEVRNLAARSANAAKETAVMIEGSIKRVEDGTRMTNETAMALAGIVEGIERVSHLVGDIAAASNKQAIGVEQINTGILQIADVVQTTSATSQETAAASEELSGQANMLRQQVSRFKLNRNQHVFERYDFGAEHNVTERMQNGALNQNLLTSSVEMKRVDQKNRKY